MILENPKPYGIDTLNNSPLDNSGVDFPCKQREGVYALIETNNWKVGEKQIISFTGTAVHGGGSCQFSVTTDLQPSKSSQWKVIHSVIGGCPASAEGNLGPGQHASTFDLELPEDMPSGKYTFAWTWFNKLGVREMYMNCAPISVSGSGNDTAFFDRLPDLFVANLPNTACATPESYDYVFPEPGDSVVTGAGAKLATSLLGTGCASVTRLGAGSGTMSDPQAIVVATGTVVSSQSAHDRKIPSIASPPSSAAVTATVTNTNASCIECQVEGTFICIDYGTFGICSNGCADRQPLAAGTYCSAGVIVKQ
jgi:hypothetical protein